MSQPKTDIDPRLSAMLREAGVPHELVSGGRHVHLRVGGRLVLVLSRGSSHSRYGQRNARATLRRFLQKYLGD